MSSVASLLRSPLAATLMCGAWVALLLAFHADGGPWTIWLAVPLTMAGISQLRTLPLIGTALVLAAAGITAFSGMAYGEIELLLPTMYVLAYLGRYLRSVTLGAICVVSFAILAAVRVDAPWYGILVSIAVNGAAWMFGLVVRRRAQQAVDAVRESAALATVDLEHTMADSARLSRLRATSVALSVLCSAVHRMCEIAAETYRGGAPYRANDVEAIRLEGDRAIGQLHDTLTMLDGGAEGASMRHHAPQSAKAGRESVDERLVAEAQRDAMSSEEAPSPAVWIMVVTLLPVSVAVVALFDAGNLPLMITSVIVPLAGLVAYRFPFVAGVAAAGAFVLAASGPRFEPNALLPIGAGLGMLIWQLTRLPQPAARVPLLIVFAGALLLGGQFGRQGIGFVVALSAIAFGAALAWKERDEILHSEQSRSVRLMAGIAAATLRAERAERMLLARELHDGVSHGITAMSLQASAAHALGATNLARAQHSMAAVLEVGERTLREIDALAQGRSDDDARTAMSLDSLIEGARATGLNIAHRPVGDADRLSYRIVQEALTNITRYAPGARVVIETGDVGAQRFVRVVDSGAVLVGASLNGTQRALENLGHGRGLIGLAERVAERDDRFRAGPLDAGFEVYAHWHHAVDEPQNAWIERQQETET